MVTRSLQRGGHLASGLPIPPRQHNLRLGVGLGAWDFAYEDDCASPKTI